MVLFDEIEKVHREVFNVLLTTCWCSASPTRVLEGSGLGALLEVVCGA